MLIKHLKHKMSLFVYFLLGIIVFNISKFLSVKYGLNIYLPIIIINIILLLPIIFYLIYYFDILANSPSILPSIYAEDDDKVKIDVKGLKITLNLLPESLSEIGNIASFNTGLLIATQLIKKSSVPIGVKLGVVLASGAASVFTVNGSVAAVRVFKGTNTENKQAAINYAHIVSTESNSKAGEFTAEVTSSGKDIVNCPLESGEMYSNIKELLTMTIGLEFCIILLLIYTILLFIFINISKKELNLN